MDRLTKSLDNFTVEVYDLDGKEYVDICRVGIKGNKPSVTFLKGDNAAAVGFISQVAELLGVGPVTIK